ncbi:MAG: DUF6290 family protein [Clostridium sp.]|uniref:DUF6290 family protein n=1 Tax=Clostridium sp. TaxID=1506 RepID=UPI001ECB7247|nr:DUF6290 family protein [Clostridium sp.]MBS5884864.1 hypothetical protein [Clostridium sp.]MDU7148359.1 DUF6290 family protein [Clostridium sp.]MDU7240929.1 DUF6290 family protein [Clostridium sp.]
MSNILNLIKFIFKKKEDSILDDKVELRLNSKEKQLIKKYCDLKDISINEFLRTVAMKEIDEFIYINI